MVSLTSTSLLLIPWLLAALSPPSDALAIETIGEGICVYSDLQDSHTNPNEYVPYPAGVPLTLTCQSDYEVYWVNQDHILDMYVQTKKESAYKKVRNLTIGTLSEKEDGLVLRCIADRTNNAVNVKLRVISGPEISLKAIPGTQSVECAARGMTEELELCLESEMDGLQCESKARIVRYLASGDRFSKITCKARLKNPGNYPALKNSTISRFEEMFEEAKAQLDPRENVGDFIEDNSRKPPVEVENKEPFGNLSPEDFLEDDVNAKPTVTVVYVTLGIGLPVLAIGLPVLLVCWWKKKEKINHGATYDSVNGEPH